MPNTNNLKSVLLIARDFPPYDAPDGWLIRSYYLAKFLQYQNYQVHIICYGREQKTDKYNVSGLYINSLNYLSLTDLLNRRNPITLVASAVAVLGKRIFRKIFGIGWIDSQELFINKYYLLALGEIIKHGIKTVIVSTPSHSHQIIGLKLKKKLGDDINWIAEFRDPWSMRRKYITRTPYMLKRINYFEQKCFANSDTCVVVSEGMHKIYKEKYPDSSLVIIENGYVENGQEQKPQENLIRFISKAKKEDRIVIGYFGVGGTGYRNDGKSFDPLLNVFHFDAKLAASFAIVTQGECNLSNNVPENISYIHLPTASNEVVRANMMHIDIGLFIYSEQGDSDLVMGGKIYDYVGSDVTPWFITPHSSYSIRRFMDVLQNGYISDIYNESTIRKSAYDILEIYKNKSSTFIDYDDNIKRIYSRDYQYSKYLDIVN